MRDCPCWLCRKDREHNRVYLASGNPSDYVPFVPKFLDWLYYLSVLASVHKDLDMIQGVDVRSVFWTEKIHCHFKAIQRLKEIATMEAEK